mmetsp:Transcript_33095/g.77447  ORF Transcript_33095/g.77447 Transcript_33095/m.77447 type:complete len:304 (+) Transcript_33095:72-983(+)|eukprot:CAMPEP_0178389660 /NCGR_PEP_ID=MMETSP0689_2-20121128/10239_1 /TAXON_ID=160604 /ORGANISM="Amphidinium massartii, Strain CS-259" /LENGTH=303 /DNA_ID=CAMNT_0020010133 /DNA_START=53 /DNA_END=964 /DNA_ORIENTATION=-
MVLLVEGGKAAVALSRTSIEGYAAAKVQSEPQEEVQDEEKEAELEPESEAVALQADVLAAEPPAREQLTVMAAGAAVGGLAYGAARSMVSRDSAEDIVDLAHAVCTSALSMHGMLSLEPHGRLKRTLPPKLASGRGPIVRMFSASLGYFLADMCKILVDVTIRKQYPHLWMGRLAHHTIQLGASLPGIFTSDAVAERTLAWRSVLCVAYVAEVSSIFLRLSNLLRRGNASWRIRQTCTWAVLASFFASRIVNFGRAIQLYIAARPVLPKGLFQLGVVVQLGGYSLSVGWFLKLLRIALRAQLK